MPPLNRIVAFFGPFVAILAGALATWLANHFPGLDVPQAHIEGGLVDALTFVTGALIAWAGQHKWLTGWQLFEERTAVGTEDIDVAAGYEGEPSTADLDEFERQSGLAAPDAQPEGATRGKPGLQ